MLKYPLFLLLFFTLTFTQVVADTQKTSNLEATKKEIAAQKELKIAQYLTLVEEIEQSISEEAVWMKSYATYLTSLDVAQNITKMKKRIKYLKRNKKKQGAKEELDALLSKEEILRSQVGQLKEQNASPFSNLLRPPEIGEPPVITNPFDIFSGISFIKKINADYEEYVNRKNELIKLIMLLQKEQNIYKDIERLDSKGRYVASEKIKKRQLERFENALSTIAAAAEVYQKRVEVLEVKINKDIEVQVYKLVNIGVLVLIVFFIFLLLKIAVKKYFTDNERFYMANKAINFTKYTIVVLIIFFSYLENVGYLVTILGFASAGIAIAMKDWFMSVLGWLVIVFGGSIHVGDRIRVDMDGMKYVGDVMDISPLRMTILEDITLTAITKNRRAGRIIFVPNNYIFTNMIANYTHSSLKTVWDGVHLTITFDSNHKKAMHLAKEIVKKYSKGYTDITRKQLNKLRTNYSLKNTNVEPRIFSFIEPNGISIDSWYLTNAYATLTLRSVISVEIVEAFNAEDDITIAYPTQKLHIVSEPKEPPFDTSEVV